MAEELTTLGPAAGRAKKALAAVGAIALAVAFALGWFRGDGLGRFLHAYLLNYCYVLSIALGALCFVAMQHACRAGWCVSVRRLCELLAAPMSLLALMGLPIVVPAWLGGCLYPWAAIGHFGAAGNELLAHKAPISTRTFSRIAGSSIFSFGAGWRRSSSRAPSDRTPRAIRRRRWRWSGWPGRRCCSWP